MAGNSLPISCTEEIEQVISDFLWSAVPIDCILSVLEGQNALEFKDENISIEYRKRNDELVNDLLVIQRLVETYTAKVILEIIKDVLDGHPMACESDQEMVECLLVSAKKEF